MIYAYKETGRWTIASLMPRFRGIGGWHTLTDADRAKHGWYPCVELNAQYNPVTQIRSPAEFVLENNIVTATYTLWDKPESQIYNEAADKVRSRRNQLILETDWRFRSDLSPSQEWIDYCQALRDITNQEGFPFNVQWPIQPSE